MIFLPETAEKIYDYLRKQLKLSQKDVEDIFEMFSKIDTRTSLSLLERIGESVAQKKIDATLEYIDEWCSDCLKPRYACPSCVYQTMKELLGYRPRLSRGEQKTPTFSQQPRSTEEP